MAEHQTLERAADAPGLARSAIARWLADSLDRSAVEDVKLLVSELVTNAVRHPRSTGAIELAVDIGRRCVRVEVTDPGTGFKRPRLSAPTPDALGGRGLLIVDRLASRWGVAP